MKPIAKRSELGWRAVELVPGGGGMLVENWIFAGCREHGVDLARGQKITVYAPTGVVLSETYVTDRRDAFDVAWIEPTS